MPHLVDLSGQEFGRYTVLSYAGKRYWNCRCECGTERRVYGTNLTRGVCRSCGCLAREMAAERNATHGYTRGYRPRSEYKTWYGMVSRCHNPKWINYADYGGRGITVCDRWRFGEDGKSGFECFVADMGDKPRPDLTLERPDASLPYGPDNCVWATRSKQARNRRSNRLVTYNGQEMLLCDALAASGISENGFYDRVAKGWTEQQALETPPFKKPAAFQGRGTRVLRPQNIG